MEDKKYYIIVEIPKYDKKYVSETYDIHGIVDFKYQLRQINSLGYVELNVGENYRLFTSVSTQLCITKEILNECIITINRLKPVD